MWKNAADAVTSSELVSLSRICCEYSAAHTSRTKSELVILAQSDLPDALIILFQCPFLSPTAAHHFLALVYSLKCGILWPEIKTK